MKLESIHIENFGGLHQYDLKLEPGLTVIHGPNGFGKTTLAEFIRAMFYGFPRKGKTLDKSKRQKYTPWQGGKFGGNLVFEYEGKRYRMERTFGVTPRGDTFALFDLETGERSDRFSDQIGLELFRLDGDSFERSAYMPQLRESEDLTTDNIQAKLSNLVEDGDDLGNFERAMAALRICRSGLIPYRGNGGTVAKAREQVSGLRAELDLLGEKEAEEEGLAREIRSGEAELIRLRATRQEIQLRMDEAQQHALAAGARREYDRLCQWEQRVSREMEDILQNYPDGIPPVVEVDAAAASAARYQALRGLPQAEWLSEKEPQQRKAAGGAFLWAAVTAILAGICTGMGFWLDAGWGKILPIAGAALLAVAVGIVLYQCREKKKQAEALTRQRRTAYNRELGRLERELEAFFDNWCLPQPENPEQALHKIRCDSSEYAWRAEELEQVRTQLRRLSPGMEQMEGSGDDPVVLRQQERRIAEQMMHTERLLAENRQKRRQLQEQLARIADVERSLEFWKGRYGEDLKKVSLLDDAMASLETARGNLQRSYMGPLRHAFFGYMEKLLGEDAAGILFTADFQVRLERFGEARELGFFSAGQSDLVMLCMRLALVDALFTAEKPFVILDDPFVNLDDAHTRQAMELLRELARDRQIIYLVCNSSRDPENM